MSKLFKIVFLFLLTSCLSSKVSGQDSVCPPVDQAALKLMDTRIQELINDQAKFNALVSTVSSENLTELTTILTRIKSKIDTGKTVSSYKSITLQDDWTRLRQILCPYLMVTPLPVSSNEPAIVFKGALYTDGSEVTVDYDNENYLYDFELKNYTKVEGKYVGWEIYSGQTDVSASSIKNFPAGASGDKFTLDANQALTYKIVAQYYKEGVRKISVNFIRKKKIFQIKNLWAIDGGDKDGLRKAKQGETLYLVRENNALSRYVYFEIETDALKKNFWPNEPIWHKYTQAEQNKRLADEREYNQRDEEYYSKSDTDFDLNSSRLRATYTFRNWSETSITSVTAFDNQQIVNIRTLTEDRVRDKASLPDPVDNALKSVTDGFDKVGTWLTEITGTKVKAEVKHDFLLDRYNSEDEASRHYSKNRQLSIGVEASISAELPIPGFKYTVPKVLEIGAYIKPGIKLRIDGGGTDKNQSETDDWKPYSFNLSGKVVGSVEAGVKAKLLIDPKVVEFELKGYAKGSVAGGVDYKRIPSKSPSNEVKLVVSIDPLILGVSAKAKVHTTILDVQLFEYAKEWWITDRINFETEKNAF